jgi:hypothetical protein
LEYRSAHYISSISIIVYIVDGNIWDEKGSPFRITQPGLSFRAESKKMRDAETPRNFGDPIPATIQLRRHRPQIHRLFPLRQMRWSPEHGVAQ